jgi:S1-C subfamily serine protease
MKAETRRILTTVIALAVAGVSVATAQERTETQRQQRIREAERRAAEAQSELERALRLLREEESGEARRAFQQSIEELQAALRQLDRDRVNISFRRSPYGEMVSVLTTGSGAKMGVYVNTERDETTDSIGARLDEVVPDGPADRAGLRSGDIITKANSESLARIGRRDTSPGSKLIEIKDELEVGDTLHVEYLRGTETRTTAIVLDELESSAWSLRAAVEPRVLVAPRIAGGESRVTVRVPEVITEWGGWGFGSWLDVELVTLDEDLGQYFGTAEGLLVIRGSEEGELDLKSGDVILDIDGRKPASQSHLLRIMRSYEAGEDMNIQIMRNRTRQTVTVTVPDRDDEFFFRRFEREW